MRYFDTLLFFSPVLMYLVISGYINIYLAFLISGGIAQSVMVALEHIRPKKQLPPPTKYERVSSLLNVVFGVVVGAFMIELFNYIVPGYAPLFSLNTVFAVVVYDFAYYGLHRWGYHGRYNSVLRKIHKSHHSIKYMDSVRGTMASFADQLIVQFVAGCVFKMYGLNQSASINLFLMFLLYQTGHHLNCELDIGFLKYVFGGPTEHVRHHEKPKKNFGVLLSIWDIFFNTFDS